MQIIINQFKEKSEEDISEQRHRQQVIDEERYRDEDREVRERNNAINFLDGEQHRGGQMMGLGLGSVGMKSATRIDRLA